ncbi:MAG: DNA polymerase III subunit alpha [Armatimonadetes bacterium]|nr:DNA polymerase III subunit alpha [Armatimonadota bacterium]
MQAVIHGVVYETMIAHLHVHSPYSFCDGAAHETELVREAAALDIPALAITDHNSLSGVVRWKKLCRAAGIKPIIGAEITLDDGTHLTLIAPTRSAYTNLCGLLTDAHLQNERRDPRVSLEMLQRWADGLICLSGCRLGFIRKALRKRRDEEARQFGERLISIFGRDSFYIELQHDLYPGDFRDIAALVEFAEAMNVPAVATHNVHYAHREQFRAHDLLTCIREHLTIDQPHPHRPINAEQWLKPAAQMRQLFYRWPKALDLANAIAERCDDYEIGGPEFIPRYSLPDDNDTFEFLRALTFQGARQRYGVISPELRDRLTHELSVIRDMGFVDYFLIVWDVIRFARRRGIRYAGRGSCCDSTVAYALGITHVDAWRRRLRFERFINPSRLNTLPDIDVDFDARRRDEVAEYVISRYGPDHVAGVCTFQRFRARGALRETAKVLGLPEHIVERIARVMPHLSADALPEAIDRLPELRNSGIEWRKLRLVIEIAASISGLPRHIGTHLGGLVISARPLTEISPLQMAAKGIRIIGFDKEDVEDLGLFKLDLLALRMLGAVDDAVRITGVDYEGLPTDDQETFKMLSRGETVGAFQLESPAQRSLHQRLRPKDYEDIIASVALIRPGPVQANMVGPFVARRRGEEPVIFTDPRIERILGKTYGVVLFQEQVIELAIEIAGFSPGEADELRRLMTHHRDRKGIEKVAQDFVDRALANGASREVAQMAFNAIKAFAGYGFCEGHAAAFGGIGYRTAYLLRHYPAQFYAALLNNQPMGFYPPHTLIVEARRRGVKILPLDINESQIDYTAGDAWLRIGLKQVKGISQTELEEIVTARARRRFADIRDFLSRVHIRRDIAERLILAGAFDALHPNRRQLLWQFSLLAS